MNAFEKEFEDKFAVIRKRTGAFLFALYPPMRCCGTRGTMPVFVQTGRALFDVAGWLPVTDGDGDVLRTFTLPPAEGLSVFIGIELKACKQRHPSLRIVGEDGTGSGVQAHQLTALAAVHRDGGIARILWNNGGVVGVLDGQEIAQVFHDYGVSVAVEKLGKMPAKGSRSIPWSLFRQIDMEESPEKVIIAPVQEPTLKESLDAKRKKASKQIEAAEQEIAEKQDAKGFEKFVDEEEDDNAGLD